MAFTPGIWLYEAMRQSHSPSTASAAVSADLLWMENVPKQKKGKRAAFRKAGLAMRKSWVARWGVCLVEANETQNKQPSVRGRLVLAGNESRLLWTLSRS